MNGIFGFYVLFFIIILWCFHHYKLYKDDKYKTYIKLFIASNVIFTVYVIFVQIDNHREEILNTNSSFYEKIMSNMFDDTLKIFRKNPKMKYFYDELFNNNGDSSSSYSSSYSSASASASASSDFYPHHAAIQTMQRDKMMEQNITYAIMSALANYSVFYYSHADLDEYKELVMNQRERVLKIVTQFLKSSIFKENLAKGLNDFAGLNLIKFFKEFFNVVPSNPSNPNPSNPK